MEVIDQIIPIQTTNITSYNHCLKGVFFYFTCSIVDAGGWRNGSFDEGFAEHKDWVGVLKVEGQYQSLKENRVKLVFLFFFLGGGNNFFFLYSSNYWNTKNKKEMYYHIKTK